MRRRGQINHAPLAGARGGTLRESTVRALFSLSVKFSLFFGIPTLLAKKLPFFRNFFYSMFKSYSLLHFSVVHCYPRQ
jgi:hypothetical protein